MWFGIAMVVVMIGEGFIYLITQNNCTSYPALGYRLFVFVALFAYLTIGQRIATLTLGLVEDRLVNANDGVSVSNTKFDKFSGIDIRFMINQVF